MEFHDAANIFPLNEEDIGDLAKDIKANGQMVPVEIYEGKVIDGRRRLLACNRIGVQPKTRVVNPEDPIAYVLSLNRHRRHLSATQLAMVGAKARDLYDRQAKERQKASGGDRKSQSKKSVQENLPEPIHGQARDQVGQAVGVSGKSIDHATKVLNNGTEKLVSAVEADLIAVSTAARASSLSEEEQDALADRASDDGHRKRHRPKEAERAKEAAQSNGKHDADAEIKLKGKGVIIAHEAINVLSRIPKNDQLRKRGFQIVTDWIRKNP